MDDALEQAKMVAGGPSGLAKRIGGISPQAISQWDRVPADRVIQVERATGVLRQALRPDIYPPVPSPQPSEADALPQAPRAPSEDVTGEAA